MWPIYLFKENVCFKPAALIYTYSSGPIHCFPNVSSPTTALTHLSSTRSNFPSHISVHHAREEGSHGANSSHAMAMVLRTWSYGATTLLHPTCKMGAGANRGAVTPRRTTQRVGKLSARRYCR